MNQDTDDCLQRLGLDRAQVPRHIAIIMDGNGRWAMDRGMDRIYGHEQGAKAVRKIVTHCARMGVETLTLYSFSTENWKRPRPEVDFLMGLYVRYLIAERDTIMGNNIRFRHLGRREGLPESVLAEMDKTVAMSRSNTGLTLCLALNYGARRELVDAVRGIATEVARGKLSVDAIDESAIADSLYTVGLPDPDLLIRTANERRISNFLLWQISYAEWHVCPTLWPDFTEEHLEAAIKDFVSRKRRYGDVEGPVVGESC